MPLPLPPTAYRIRGLSDLAIIRKPKKSLPAPETKIQRSPIGQVIRAFGRPHITDILYHAGRLDTLAAYWPTFDYLRPRSGCQAIKEWPIHLAEYIEPTKPRDICEDILDLADAQETEEKLIAGVLFDADEGAVPDMNGSPLAMAFLCVARHGHPWLTTNQNEVLKVILQSSEASYVALATGFYQGDVMPLLAKISENPGLTIEVWQNPGLRREIRDEWFRQALEPYPAHLARALCRQGKWEEAQSLLYHSAGSDPLCAGLCLGIDPGNENSNEWFAAAAGSPAAFYRMGKAWKEAGHDIADHPHVSLALTEVSRSPRWHYHWLRDVTPFETGPGLRELWPSPWAVELIVDLGLPPRLVLDLIRHHDLNPRDPIESSILLWAQDYTHL